MLADVLADEYATGGVDAAVKKYHELRGQYQGTWSYDFSFSTSSSLYPDSLDGVS